MRLTTLRMFVLATLCVSPALTLAQRNTPEATALVGLARTARDRGRPQEAFSYFREADTSRPLEGGLLVEYFWAAHHADAPQAREIGARVLRANAADADVRDGLIGLAVRAGGEADVQTLAAEGARRHPDAALWPRRLAESALRRGDMTSAAAAFATAARLSGGAAYDLAQRALALELGADRKAAAAAWAALDDSLVRSRAEWSASRDRARRATAPSVARLPKRPAAPVAPPAADAVASASTRALEGDACATGPLRALEALPDEDPLVEAVRTRPATCAEQAAWRVKAADRAIAVGRFADAIALLDPVARAEDAPVGVRAMFGMLQQWTGDSAGAIPWLERAAAEDAANARASDALVDAYRATGRPDAAWPVATGRAADGTAPVARRLVVAALALETGRVNEALSYARGIAADAAVGAEARRVAAGALVALDRAAEARRELGSLDAARPDAALTWLESVALDQGIGAALSAATPVDGRTGSSWAEVNARLALWHAQMGRRREAARRVDALTTDAPVRGELAAAELALVVGRPADAVTRLDRRLARTPDDWRALDLLATALAESDQWQRAFDVLGRLRLARPDDVRLALREAEWRHRQSPSPERLAAVAAVAGRPDGHAVMARAALLAGAPDRAVAALRSLRPETMTDYELWLAARAERAAGRPERALSLVDTRAYPSLDLRLLGAELAGALMSDAAVAERFSPLVSGDDADPTWFLAWATAVNRPASARQVLTAGTAAFPTDAALHERLAVVTWALGDVPAARDAAERAIALDGNLLGSWFVAVHAANRTGDHTGGAATVRTFGQRFQSQPSALLAMAETVAGLGRTSPDDLWREAMAWTMRIRAEQPELPAGVVAHARLLASVASHAEALRETEAFLRGSPGSGTARKLRAELLLGSSRFADALAAYEDYLALEPGDVAAARQQARIARWQGDVVGSLARFDELVRRHPAMPGIAHERDTVRAAARGRWQEALVTTERWLDVEPDDVEAQLERAQTLDRLGRPREGREMLQAVAARMPGHQFAGDVANRIDLRGRTGVDVFATGLSADGAVRRQLLDLVDSGVGVSTGPGGLGQRRIRLFAGPSAASVPGVTWRGYNLGADARAAVTARLDLGGVVTRRALDGMAPSWFGHLRGDWRVGETLRVAAGAERVLVLDNRYSLESGLAAYGPLAGIRWRPAAGTTLDVNARYLAMSDGNQRRTLRADAAQRLWHRVHEVRLVVTSEFLGHDETRPGYFAPRGFWRHDAGVDGRLWLSTPRAYGDRERFVSGAYLYGVDNRGEHYHTGRVGLSYDVTPGTGVVASVLVVRSRVYDGVVASAGLRIRQAPAPSR